MNDANLYLNRICTMAFWPPSCRFSLRNKLYFALSLWVKHISESAGAKPRVAEQACDCRDVSSHFLWLAGLVIQMSGGGN